MCPEDVVRLEAAGVAVRTSPIAALEPDGGILRAVRFADGPPLRCDALFVASTTRQRSDLVASLRCAVLPDGGVEVDDFGRTDLDGVYAAGDMAHRRSLPMPFASVTAAGASGQVAAAAIDQDLLSEDFVLANPFAGVAAR